MFWLRKVTTGELKYMYTLEGKVNDKDGTTHIFPKLLNEAK